MFKFIARNFNCKSKARLFRTSTFKKNEKSDATHFDSYTTVYKFKYIKEIGLINRLKLYQTIFTTIAIPTSVILWRVNLVNPEVILATSVIGLGACTFFHSIGIFANNFIGFVYLNKKEDRVKVAYVDFWGRRCDIEMPLEDIIPLTEIPSSILDRFYVKFTRFSISDQLKLNITEEYVLDKEKFKKIFALD